MCSLPCLPEDEGQPPGVGPVEPLPVIEVPFLRITVDVVDLLPKSSARHQYIFVFIDYTTQYSEAVPLRAVTMQQIAAELIKWIP